MRVLPKLLLLFSFILILKQSNAQETKLVDSIKIGLAKATTFSEKVDLLDQLSKVMMNVNPQEADEIGKRLIATAEESRDRKLMVKAYISNGVRCSFFAQRKEYIDKAIEYFTKALEVAKTNRLEEETGGAQLYLSGIYLANSDNEKALSYVTQAFSLISTLSNDSLRAASHNAYGQVYQAKNEKILALRNFLNALRIAEDIKNNPLIKDCYIYLANFYSSIEDFDKAIDYYTLAYKKLDVIKGHGTPYMKVVYISAIGNLYARKKSYDISISYFERSIKMADSLHFSTLKIPGYISLLNQYLRMDQPQKALNYMNSVEGDSIKSYLSKFGLVYVIDQAYGVIYNDLGRYDSAGYYLLKAKPGFEKGVNPANMINFYAMLADYYYKSGDNKNAIDTYLKVKDMSEANGLLENVKAAAKYLDTLYNRTGNIPLAGKFKAVFYQYKDSIETLNREKELAQVEADDEQKRQAKIEKEEEDRERRKNNIQYMSITIGIVFLFVVLVILGMFKVSVGAIKAISFFAFLMFFEFIFLVFKKNIHSLTHGEPWKDLAFMIALAALLVPLHHWLEHRVLHYLTSHNRLTSAGHHIKNRLFGKTKP
jgi:tetratricopeptide (TPR) repeat protein